MSIRKDCGLALKTRLEKKESCLQIAQWAYAAFMQNIETISRDDPELGNVLIILSQMEEGREFEMSDERLMAVAEDLISGKKEINMDY